jgi:hypothetical protein
MVPEPGDFPVRIRSHVLAETESDFDNDFDFGKTFASDRSIAQITYWAFVSLNPAVTS